MPDDAPDHDGGTDDETPPVACTLGEADYQARRPWMVEEFLPLLADVERRESGVTMRFEGTDGTVQTVARFVDEESDCCAFARYELAIEPPYEQTRLTITGPEGTGELFGEGFSQVLEDPPETLAELPEVVAERHSPT